MANTRYTPVLKAREAEIRASAKAPRALRLVPIFELQRATPPRVNADTGLKARGKGTRTDASYFLDDIARLWEEEMYVDIGRVAAPDDRPTWWNLLATLNRLSEEPASLIPVVTVNASGAELNLASLAASRTRKLALRFSPDTSIELVLAQVESAATALDGDPSQIDVLLDYGDSLYREAYEHAEARIAKVLEALGDNRGYASLLGTPDSTEVAQAGDWSLPRHEWKLWKRLHNGGTPIDFGDYALYQTADPVPAAPQYGHLRYSSGDALYVHRRAQPRSGGGLAAAFADCCRHLTKQDHWLGEAFSGADARIAAVADSEDKVSEAGKWRELAYEHHFALVARQLYDIELGDPPIEGL